MILNEIVNSWEEKPLYCNYIINIAIRISEQHPDAKEVCSKALLERKEWVVQNGQKITDEDAYDKYANIIIKENISDLDKPDYQEIMTRLSEFLERYISDAKSSRGLHEMATVTELVSNCNWSLIDDSNVKHMMRTISEWMKDKELHSHDYVELYRAQYYIAKNASEAIKKFAIDIAFDMYGVLDTSEMYEQFVERERNRMPIPTNLNHGKSYGLLYILANLLNDIPEERAIDLLDWINRIIVCMENISMYYACYILFYYYLSDNGALANKAEIGLNQFRIMVREEMNRSVELYKDTLLGVLQALHSIYEAKEYQKDVYDFEKGTNMIEWFLEKGEDSGYIEKQRLVDEIRRSK